MELVRTGTYPGSGHRKVVYRLGIAYFTCVKKAIWQDFNALGGAQIMTRQSFADMDCGVAQAVEQIGDKWTLLIVRNAFLGMTRFDDFAEHLGIASNILAGRLDMLVRRGILLRRKLETDGRGQAYKLSPKGLDLFPLLVFLNQWGEKWMGEPGAAQVELSVRATGCALRPLEVLADDGTPVTPFDTVFGPGAAGSQVLETAQEILARRQAASP